MSDSLKVVEICAGAGGQALGLEKAGFEHELAVELDANACATLRMNRSDWKVIEGDVADRSIWNPSDYEGIDLLAGGVPCPPFTVAGKQLGATDERDLFAWAIELASLVRPRALLLENVRGLSMPRFRGYRQHVLDRLADIGYIAEWKLLQASEFGVPQLRPRFVLVALQPAEARYFSWPEAAGKPPTVGQVLADEMASDGWEGATEWANKADEIAPTIVGGSKKHGGADLGPTRAKRAWAKLGVDALGVADAPPSRGNTFTVGPKLTSDMVARIQGWDPDEWVFSGRKTTKYRQIGNAFPPPVATALGNSIKQALLKVGERNERLAIAAEHDGIYRALRTAQQHDDSKFLSHQDIERALGITIEASELERRITLLRRDFEIAQHEEPGLVSYKIGEFKAFTGQDDHVRNELFSVNRAKIS